MYLRNINLSFVPIEIAPAIYAFIDLQQSFMNFQGWQHATLTVGLRIWVQQQTGFHFN